MRIKKSLSAAVAACLTVSAMFGTGAFQASAADEKTLTFDIRSNGKNEIVISSSELEAGDITIPVDIFIPENPGVNGINLKFQINDGEVSADGTFGNYGFSFNDGMLASPFCFDSVNEGDAAQSLAAIFNSAAMNLNWCFSASCDVNADAAAQENTTFWDKTASWAYTDAFATTNLVIPKDTKPGEYKLDIRKEKYLNSLSAGSAKPQYGKSTCVGADQESALDFESVPLTVVVKDIAADDNVWQDDYKIENGGHYLIIADVSGAPGETVSVPVFVYGDPGTAGLQVFFDVDPALTLDEFEKSKDKNAYNGKPITNAEIRPASYTFAGNLNTKAPDGAILTNLNVIIPQDAKDGTTYNIKFTESDGSALKVVDRDKQLNVKFYDGSVTVLADKKTALNRASVTLTDEGQTTNLSLFNATGDVTWKSSDDSVATVDANGFVVAKKKGTAEITATNNGNDFKCTVKVGGLFGDVDENGEISSSDAQLVLTHYAEVMAGNPAPLSAEKQAIGDVSGDGITDITDAQFILNYYVEKVVSGLEDTTWRKITGNPNAPDDQ